MAIRRYYSCPHCKSQISYTYGEVLYIGEPIIECSNCGKNIVSSNTMEWEFFPPWRRKFLSLGCTTIGNIIAKCFLIPVLLIGAISTVSVAWYASLLFVGIALFFTIPPIVQFYGKATQEAICQSLERTSHAEYVSVLIEILGKTYYPLSSDERNKIISCKNKL